MDLEVKHIKGLNNVYTDILSRWRIHKYLQIRDVKILKNCYWQQVSPEILYIYIVLWCQIKQNSAAIHSIVDSPLMEQLVSQADKGIAAGPRTATSYLKTFNLFLSFVVYMEIITPHTPRTIIVYLEFIAQNNFKIASLRNHLSVLKHYCGLFGWPISAFADRRVKLLLK